MKHIIIAIISSLALIFVQNAEAQNNQYPNELQGYEFFGKGKLKELVLGISSREDVSGIFGEVCEELCVYNESWNIKFHYFDNWTTTKYQNGTEQKFISSPEFKGRLWVIEIFPRKEIPFSEMSFPNVFRRTQGVVVGQGFKSAFEDSNGLSYLFETESQAICELTKYRNLAAIRYSVSAEINKKAWVLIK